ncbi:MULTISPECIES: ATP-binding protein [unclassified Oceanispirochaeta]|uniref:ATP-binding protein n=1 Tax=unclassified Oceanispirochaeta TaxID=2635722 RepID=UPI000E08F291|nr:MULTISPECIES: SbcC/MukB-like Walker B domain-containing protein [unclassified Oceanispirochaeta]MBF9015969.1 ATP-dependent exonuclease SbcCD, C subunit-like protein [Oceanispirochaeta sp. M2]NPD72432.1 ATP-dependent exonuclease SbcCD, C subunit-like protein [Oceanispirochaeta sp. M1]RDG32199.1 ATP-dependent exonuclease SbcCD, C subunit-like protein [Oceanispirochaeta sp. M1]
MSSFDNFLDFATENNLAGFRLEKLEVMNWGTFHKQIWTLKTDSLNTLLTGDIGSGKSTLVDALTTLLVPPGKVSYNKAAGAEFKERSLRSYMLGYYKSERSDSGYAAKPVPLRDAGSYTVLLAVFSNAGFSQKVTLAQVFWHKDGIGQPGRFYLVSDQALSIKEHFSGFGSSIKELRKQLRGLSRTEPLFDNFRPYAAAFRRRFGLKNEQALDLFHQTVSMKSVGNLTSFVQDHMLESFAVEPRIEALIQHFDDLNRAHESVIKAREQIDRLQPLSENIDTHKNVSSLRESLRENREDLRSYFAAAKRDLLVERVSRLDQELEKLELKKQGHDQSRRSLQKDRDRLKLAVSENGGDRLEQLKNEKSEAAENYERRLSRYEEYNQQGSALDLPAPSSTAIFLENRKNIDSQLEDLKSCHAHKQNALAECTMEMTVLRKAHRELYEELESLKTRKSNIDLRQIRIRDSLCAALAVDVKSLPFAGELMMIDPDESPWEGAAERLLRSFGLSLLVPDELYARAASWVDKTHLKGRLVYFRVVNGKISTFQESSENSLIHKIRLKGNSPFKDWLEEQLHRRFDYSCCEDMDQFRKSAKALSLSGQIKGSRSRHEKDDRHSLHDRSRYILGWVNDDKIKTLESQLKGLENRIQSMGLDISGLQNQIHDLDVRRDGLNQLKGFGHFDDLNWTFYMEEGTRLDEELSLLEKASDVLKILNDQLIGLEERLLSGERELDSLKDRISRKQSSRDAALDLINDCRNEIEENDLRDGNLRWRELDELRLEVLGNQPLKIENCDSRERDLREWIQKKIDSEDKKLKNLSEKIIREMESFRTDYPVECRDMDAALDGAGEYQSLLNQLLQDDLPRFEEKFKEELNKNTIREIASFQSILSKESQEIRERIEQINKSMSAIEYNKDRYILLEALPASDHEIRTFRQDLRACMENSFTGQENDQYTESKFIQVKEIINRFRGREGLSDLDRRWTRKVTDVRNWFVFAASERWKEDDSEYEHYTDSGGKSGGQKEKLAYTVLAASLAYQFGLEWGEIRSRSFRFVVIDEAFGRGSDESARYGLELFKKLNLQLLIVTPLQKIHIIEPYVSSVGFVHNEEGKYSRLRGMTMEEYSEEKKRWLR